MSGSSDYHIEPTHSFAESLVILERETYGRNDKRGIEQLREHVGQLFDNLLGWPQIAGLRPEPLPPNTAASIGGWTLHKLTFSCPRANGAARQGRLMILVNQAERLIRPIYIYTHAQFASRVPDGSLKELVLKAARSNPRIQIPAPTPASDPASALASPNPATEDE